MTLINPVEEMDELEQKIAASSATDKKIVTLHVRRLNATASLNTVPTADTVGNDQLFDDDEAFDNVPV